MSTSVRRLQTYFFTRCVIFLLIHLLYIQYTKKFQTILKTLVIISVTHRRATSLCNNLNITFLTTERNPMSFSVCACFSYSNSWAHVSSYKYIYKWLKFVMRNVYESLKNKLGTIHHALGFLLPIHACLLDLSTVPRIYI